MDVESGHFPDQSVNQQIPRVSESISTIDEPISATILRDLKQIGYKIRYVLLPNKNDGMKELRDWDLWGPLLLCLLLAGSLSFSAKADQTSLVFAAVFVIVWLGAGIVTLNALLLGGKISFFQSICVLGYCIAPICVASLLCHAWSNFIFKFVLTLVCYLWACRATVGFMAQLVPKNRKHLGIYPIVLFYMALGWMVVCQ